MLQETIEIIKKAGNLVKSLRDNQKVCTFVKDDGSCVTSADHESEALLLREIYKHFGNDQIIISEEEIANGKQVDLDHHSFWLLDPIDATQSYIDNKNDYCINVTYMENRQPKLGLIYAPETDTVWYAEKNKGSFKLQGNQKPIQIHTRSIPKNATAVVSMPRHQLTEDLINKYNITEELVIAGAIKFCYIAEGKADYYFRTRNKACDWDISSGHIIVEEAGGQVIFDPKDNFSYGNKPYLAPGLIARGKSS
ncbi:3'(2'),5'-bisphosphate nucleotidase CysQ [Rickettsiales bacterium LUAb2]